MEIKVYAHYAKYILCSVLISGSQNGRNPPLGLNNTKE